jgi:hypothetical protein
VCSSDLLPIFREIMLRVYKEQLVGPVPEFPREIEERITQYLARPVASQGLGAARFLAQSEWTKVQ